MGRSSERGLGHSKRSSGSVGETGLGRDLEEAPTIEWSYQRVYREAVSSNRCSRSSGIRICIYSQLKRCSSSEVAAMIEGLLRHCTEMSVEKNYVDSHGQSEVAFAFCHLLGFDLLPRLKGISKKKLYRAWKLGAPAIIQISSPSSPAPSIGASSRDTTTRW